MIKCANDNCNVNVIESEDRIVVTQDGDMVCCLSCKKEWEYQRDYFFSNIVSSSDKTTEYLLNIE